MSRILAFTENERRIIPSAVDDRYRGPVEIREPRVEVRLYPAARALTACPALCWRAHGA